MLTNWSCSRIQFVEIRKFDILDDVLFRIIHTNNVVVDIERNQLRDGIDDGGTVRNIAVQKAVHKRPVVLDVARRARHAKASPKRLNQSFLGNVIHFLHAINFFGTFRTMTVLPAQQKVVIDSAH